MLVLPRRGISAPKKRAGVFDRDVRGKIDPPGGTGRWAYTTRQGYLLWIRRTRQGRERALTRPRQRRSQNPHQWKAILAVFPPARREESVP